MTHFVRVVAVMIATEVVANVCLKKFQASTGFEPVISVMPGQMFLPLRTVKPFMVQVGQL